MKYSLEIKNLTKRYESFALENVSLNLPKGTIMGLIGENGSGKTTLLNTILGVTLYHEGEIFIDGCEHRQNEMAIKETVEALPPHH